MHAQQNCRYTDKATTGGSYGLDVSGSDIVADTKEDQAYYHNQNVGTKQIIDDQVHNAQADKLRTALPS